MVTLFSTQVQVILELGELKLVGDGHTPTEQTTQVYRINISLTNKYSVH